MLIGDAHLLEEEYKTKIQELLDEDKLVLIAVKENTTNSKDIELELRKVWWRYLSDEKVKIILIPDVISVEY